MLLRIKKSKSISKIYILLHGQTTNLLAEYYNNPKSCPSTTKNTNKKAGENADRTFLKTK